MTRALRGTGRGLVLTAVLVLSAGCSGGAPAADPEPGAHGTPAGSASTSPSPDPAPAPGDLDTPATSSGPLSQHSFPRPKQLGAGWKWSVDPGDAEEGYSGNGTPALARNPQEIVQVAVPFGCARKARLSTPAHALEVDYTFRGTKVIALRMSFADPAASKAFHDARTQNLQSCKGRSAGAGIGVLVRSVAAVGRYAVLNDRTPDSDPWSELAVLDGSDVVLVASQSAPGRPPLTRDGARRLAAAFRR